MLSYLEQRLSKCSLIENGSLNLIHMTFPMGHFFFVPLGAARFGMQQQGARTCALCKFHAYNAAQNAQRKQKVGQT